MASWEINLSLPQKLDSKSVERVARMAINSTVRRSRAWFAAEIMKEVNFPSGYLSPSGGRFSVDRLAGNSSLEASLRGRDRATSLSRFITGTDTRSPYVSVHKGKYTRIKGAFIVSLRNGVKGLAVRVPIGERPRGAWLPKPLGNGVWLLYAPSVDQVFKEQLLQKNPVYERTFNFLETEFDRLYGLYLTGDLKGF